MYVTNVACILFKYFIVYLNSCVEPSCDKDTQKYRPYLEGSYELKKKKKVSFQGFLVNYQ